MSLILNLQHYQIWSAILIMIAISLAILLILLIARIFADRAKAVKQNRTEYLEKKIIAYLESPIKNGKNLFKFRDRDGDIIAEIAIKILRIVTGDEKERLLNFLHDFKIDALMVSNLSNSRPTRRILAIELLSFFVADRNIFKKIITKLSDKSFSVRHAIYMVLAATEEQKYFPLIYHKIIAEKQISYPILCDIFSKFGSNISGELIKILQENKVENKIKAAAIKVLGDFRDMENLQSIVNFCHHKNDNLRALAYESLAKLNTKIPSMIIFAGIKDKFWQVRYNAIKLLANIDFADFEKLENLLNDNNWMVRNQALQIIFDAGIKGKKFLIKLASCNNAAGKVAYQYLNEKNILNNV